MAFKSNCLEMPKTSQRLTISTNSLNKAQWLNATEAKKTIILQRFKLAQQSFRDDI